MSDATIGEPPPEDDTASPRSSRRWLLVVGLIVAVLVLGGVVAAVVIADDDDEGGPDYAAAQIGWMHQGCEQWADSYQGANGPDTEWCSSMAGWMDGRMGNDQMMGQGQMMGSMMWQDPASMRTTCEQWMATSPNVATTGPGTTAWCGQMVDWMNQHMGGWDNWMTNGPMMSQP